jgi:hypothetical protein
VLQRPIETAGLIGTWANRAARQPNDEEEDGRSINTYGARRPSRIINQQIGYGWAVSETGCFTKYERNDSGS